MGKATIDGGSTASISTSNAAFTLLAASTSTKGAVVINPITNTGRLFFNDNPTAPTTSVYCHWLDPGDEWYDERQVPYTGLIQGIYSLNNADKITVGQQT